MPAKMYSLGAKWVFGREAAALRLLVRICLGCALAVIGTYLVGGTIAIAVMSIATRSPFGRNIDLLSEPFPYVLLAAGFFTFLTLLVMIWRVHHHLSRPTLYGLLGLGAVSIPLSAAWVHYAGYRADPERYRVSDADMPFIQRLSREFIASGRGEISRIEGIRREIGEVRTMRQALGPYLSYRGPGPEESPCALLELNERTGLICVSRNFNPITENYTALVFASPDLRATTKALNLSPLVVQSRFYCPMPYVFQSGTSFRTTISTDHFLKCLGVASDALGGRARAIAADVDRAARYPPLSFWAIFVDSLAGIVGAKYDLLKPVAPLAGLVNVLASLLSFAYFVLFASFILESAARASSEAGPGRA